MQYDVVIVGGGLAGLYAALHLKEEYSCVLLTKSGLTSCNSSLAQGVVAAVTDWDEDGIGAHLEDTLIAGAGMVDEEAASFMVERGPEEINWLASHGLRFDQDAGGHWRLTREGGHTRRRVLHCGGDATGAVMVDTLIGLVSRKPNVDVMESRFLTDILTDKQGRVNGLITCDKSFHPMKDLAPRDILAREIYRQMQSMSDSCVMLDATCLPPGYAESRFPSIYKRCMDHDIDMAKEPIPVVPVQHYMMGGIATDLHGRTSISGLYACGETACTGVHGANRLASNSLLECLVFARQCVTYINHHHPIPRPLTISSTSTIRETSPDLPGLVRQIKETMQENGGIIRNYAGLTSGIGTMDVIIRVLETDRMDSLEKVEVYNMALVAREILMAARDRKDSVGAHYMDW